MVWVSFWKEELGSLSDMCEEENPLIREYYDDTSGERLDGQLVLKGC